MIATHNMKVNGRWIRAGESYGEPGLEEIYAPALTGKAENAPAEVPDAPKEARPKTARRKKAE